MDFNLQWSFSEAFSYLNAGHLGDGFLAILIGISTASLTVGMLWGLCCLIDSSIKKLGPSFSEFKKRHCKPIELE
jgi:hypothetical protein